MKKLIVFLFTVVFLVATRSVSFAQFPEDLLRYSYPGVGVGARSLGMGTAYTGVANDFSAAFWNPAGLAQVRANEVSLGLSHLSYGNTSTFLGNDRSLTNSSTSLNDLGILYSVPVRRGSLVLGIGYGRQADFTTGLSARGFNANESIVQYWAPNGQPYPDDFTRAEALELARADTINGVFVSPLDDSLTQSVKALEGGGQNYVSFAGAIEAAQNLYLGLTLNFITGSYSYQRTYREEDLEGVYANRYPFDIDFFEVQDRIDADLSGFTAKLGMLYRFNRGRVGVALKTPSWMTIRETYSSDAESHFLTAAPVESKDFFDPPDGDPGTVNEYDVMTPYILSAGLSYEFGSVMLAGDIEYSDWTQMEFRNASGRLLDMNSDIKEIFHPTVNIRLGGELAIPETDARVRAGFAYLPSPYEGDPSSYSQKFITGGLGFVIQNAVAVDLGYAYGYWETFHEIYPGVRTTVESVNTHNLITTVAYRF